MELVQEKKQAPRDPRYPAPNPSYFQYKTYHTHPMHSLITRYQDCWANECPMEYHQRLHLQSEEKIEVISKAMEKDRTNPIFKNDYN